MLGGLGADHAERVGLQLHGYAGLEDRKTEHGLAVGHRLHVELGLLPDVPQLDTGFLRQFTR